ncbi:MAG: guanine deaminase [candidate division WOR-3 bacterium]|nr:guanine deaminase [candidate division WOR-3 bacterium]MCX7757048.1 guanine deaminase [candidate division WOR-3 bacterium]MDW7987252.1 guanine deaminase [candidate division WOR-3 bacterium]
MKIYRARVLNIISLNKVEDFRNGYVAVDNHGKFFDYGEFSDSKLNKLKRVCPDLEVIDFTDYIILPAFIDMHLHLPQFHLRGRYGVSLLDWLKNHIIPAETKLTYEEQAHSYIKAFYEELYRNGTTTAVIFSSASTSFTDKAFEVASELGFRVILGKAMMDRKYLSMGLKVENAQKAMHDSIKLYEKWHKSKDYLFYAFSPRFAPATSEKLLKLVGEFAQKNDVYIHTHLAETQEEVKLVKKLFPKYKNYTEVYYRTGILGPRTIVAHAIHLKESEYKLLAKTNTKVAHCPSSNFFLHSGQADTQKMVQYGIELGLGSDVGAGPSFSLFTIMRDAYYVRKMPPPEAFYYATLGSAKALGLEKYIGNIGIGKDADFLVIKYPYWCRKDSSTDILMSQLMFLGNDHLTLETYSRGVLKYRKAN